MAISKDRVMETAASPGSGTTVTLAGAVAGYRSFQTAFAINDDIFVAVETQTAGTWETGVWRLTASTTLTRQSVLSSSAGGTTAPTYAGPVNVFAMWPGSALLDLSTAGTQLLVGISTPRVWTTPAVTPVVQIEGGLNNTGAMSLMRTNSGGPAPARFLLGKSRGTNPGDNTIITAGDQLGEVQFSGNDGSTQAEAASILVIGEGTPGAGSMPAKMQLATTASGANIPTVRFTLNSVGNAALNSADPAAWVSTTRALDIGGTTALSNNGVNSSTLSNNYYVDSGSAFVYKVTGFAGAYSIRTDNGNHHWFVTASGTAGGTTALTQAMMLNPSGQVGIGTGTSPVALFDVRDTNSWATPIATPAARFAVNNGGFTPGALQGLVVYNNLSNGATDTTLVYGATTLSYFAVGHHNGTAYAERFRVHASGGMSLGNTTDPGAASLSVTGNLSIGGNITLTGTATGAFGGGGTTQGQILAAAQGLCFSL